MLRAPTNPIASPADRLPLPAGGNPAADDRFREWADGTLEDWARWAGHELMPSWRFHGHLYKHFGGPLLEDGRTPIWRYRLRWLAIAYHRDPRAFDLEARRYCLEQFHANESPGKASQR